MNDIECILRNNNINYIHNIQTRGSDIWDRYIINEELVYMIIDRYGFFGNRSYI